MTTALLCPICGAPLPLAAATERHATCDFCRAVLRQEGGQVAPTSRETQAPSAEHAARRVAFVEALKAVQLGGDPYPVICEAARAHLGTLGQSDAVARVTLGLAAEFEASTGASVRSDPMALARLAEAYLLANAELRQRETAQINLPFLTATASGPLNFTRSVTAAQLATLMHTPTPPAKKKGWWPF